MVKNPNWRRQTSWLFTKRVGFEFGATEDKSIQWQGGELEPGTSVLQVQRPNHWATLASLNSNTRTRLSVKIVLMVASNGFLIYVLSRKYNPVKAGQKSKVDSEAKPF